MATYYPQSEGEERMLHDAAASPALAGAQATGDAAQKGAGLNPHRSGELGNLCVTCGERWPCAKSQPSRLSDDDRRAAFMAGYHAHPEAEAPVFTWSFEHNPLAGDRAEDCYSAWLAQRPEAQR
jgi:hypothetical protein